MYVLSVFVSKTGECRDGICMCSGGIYAGTRCEGNCTDHGGAIANGTSCANCTGLWVGTVCKYACDCNGHGTQIDIASARSAGSCSAGTCVNCTDNFAGALCERSCGENGTSDGRTCTCDDPYFGEFCEHECINGRLWDHGQGIVCSCRNGYRGKECDLRYYSGGGPAWV